MIEGLQAGSGVRSIIATLALAVTLVAGSQGLALEPIPASSLQGEAFSLLDVIEVSPPVPDRDILPPDAAFTASEITVVSSEHDGRWFRFSVFNDQPHADTLFLEIPILLLGNIQVVSERNGSRSSVLAGTTVSSPTWPVEPGLFIFPVELVPGQLTRVFFRTEQQTTYPFLPRIGTERAVVSEFHRSRVKNYLIAGSIGGLVLLNIMAMTFTGMARTYRYYLIQTVFLFLFVIYSNGWMYPPLMAWPTVYESIYSVLVPVALIFQVAFTRQFFQTWDKSPGWDKVMRVIAWAFFVAMLLGVFFGVNVGLVTIGSITLPTIILMSAMTCHFWLRGYESSGIFAIAYNCYFFAIGATMAGYMGYIPMTAFVREFFQIGIAAQIFFFSLAVGNQMRIYREREATAALESALAKEELTAKSTFLTRMSHELRTPLNGVVGTAQLLQNTQQTEQQTYYSDMIIKSGQLLLSVINDILDFSKMSAGKLNLESRSFDIQQVICDTLAIFMPTMNEKQVAVYFSSEPGDVVNLIGDAQRLKQIWVNLIGNALKFTEQGQVDVRLRLKPKSAGEVELQFDITDTGIGMDEKTLAGIFDEFSQGDIGARRQYGGSGLGLPIVQTIVANMGGKISASSQLGHGSTFSVSLPFTMDVEAEEERKAALERLRGLTFMVVAEIEYVRAMFGRNLGHWGATVRSLADYDEALAQLDAAEHFDCLIVDISTDTLSRRLFERFQSHGLPVYFVYYNEFAPRADELPEGAHIHSLPAPMQQMLMSISSYLSGSLEEPPVLVPDRAKDLSHLSVLLVEDNAVNRAVTDGFLGHWNIAADIAEDGQQAVEKYQSGDYDLILMDCDMPVLDGYGAARKIRQLEQGSTRHSRIVALTAHVLSEEHRRCYEAGMDDVLTKPFGIEEIGKVLGA